MDILDPSGLVEKGAPKKFKIYSRNYAQPPSIVSKGATVKNAFIAEGCVIKGTVINSVVSTGCRIEEGATVTDSVIMPNSTIGPKATVEFSIVGERCTVGEGARIGAPKTDGDWGVAVVGSDKSVGEGEIVAPKTVV
jgi:glucose-1-phosphate adenylyltransferase